MGNVCSTDPNQMRDYQPVQHKGGQFNPSASRIEEIKYGHGRIPRKHHFVESLNSEAGEFRAKNPYKAPSGQKNDPRHLNEHGLIYVGEWLHGLPHGKGELYYPNGSYYVGYFVKGSPSYQGRFVCIQGWIYEGELLNEQAQGRGTLYHRQLRYKFEGEWMADLPNGSGKQQWMGSKIYYEGEFLEGKKHGEGRYRTPEYEYTGNFNNNQFDSAGFLEYRNGDKYQGTFENGKKNGKGVYTWRDGSYYEGYFKHDMKNGQGLYKSKDSVYWQGEWVNGKRQGMGTLVTDRKKYVGNWVDSVPQHPNIPGRSRISDRQRSFQRTQPRLRFDNDRSLMP